MKVKSPDTKKDPDLQQIEKLHEELESLQFEKIKLSKQLAFYRVLLNPPNTFIYINDLINERKVWSNDNFEYMSGYTLDEAKNLGKKYFQIAYHEEDTNIFSFSKNTISKNAPQRQWSGLFRFKTKTGQLLWVYALARIFKWDSQDKPWLLICVGKNITDNIESEKHLRKLINENFALKYQGIKKLLSNQEKDILKHLAEGCSSKQIADKKNLSYHTIETHRKNILNKLELKNTAELIRLASYGELI